MMLTETKQNGPEYMLIERGDSKKACAIHAMEELIHVYNSPDWTPEIVGLDKLRFKCGKCQSVRVYKIMPEKTLL